MPDIGHRLLNSSSLAPIQSPNLNSGLDQCESSSGTIKTLEEDESCGCSWEERLRHPILHQGEGRNGSGIRGLKRCRGNKASGGNTLDGYVKEWADKRIQQGVSEEKCVLPFLVGAQKMVECRVCQSIVYPGTEVLCSIQGCQASYHLTCAKERLGFSSWGKFKCPQHACYLCKQKFQLWRCVRCDLASHVKCAAFPEHVQHLDGQPGLAICWKHHDDWRQEKKVAAPTKDIEEIFCRLPLPYEQEEFDIDMSWKGIMENELEPPPFVHIRRNVYLVKKKRDVGGADIGCTSCTSSACSEDCVCRVQCISCSKACGCSDMCTNRPFRKEKKIKVVKTELCGWGVEACEPINKGDFIIEYTGEVINDALCEERLWDMKHMGIKNFYMCEIRKDFTIDATFKGNISRFLNHSCHPNCNLEKWQVEGEIRIGVFAARAIKAGEPLTYDYRFVQFGQEVKCHCGAPNCQGYLGAKRKNAKDVVGLRSWGSKGKRTPTATVAIIKR